MRSYRNQVSPCWLLIVAVIISASVAQSVTVGFNESAILPCGRKCSGLVRWTMADSPDVELAWCDQISCSSLEGFIISHEQYREGNFSLTITAADYTTTGLYTCQCGGKDVCDVYLSIKQIALSGQIDPGGSLILDVPMPTFMVTFLRHGDDSQRSIILCEVTRGKVNQHPDYKNRILFRTSLELKELKASDSGLYTVWDNHKDNIIAEYNLTVTGLDKEFNRTTPSRKGTQKIKWEHPGIIITLLVLPVVFSAFITWRYFRKKRSKHDQCPDDEKSDPAALTSLYTKTGKDKLSCDELCDLKA